MRQSPISLYNVAKAYISQVSYNAFRLIVGLVLYMVGGSQVNVLIAWILSFVNIYLKKEAYGEV